jgi:alkylation response protein AidB-like acyl-CoA dehydrogenase
MRSRKRFVTVNAEQAMADDMKTRGAAATLLAFTPEELEIMNAAAGVLGEALPLARLHGPQAMDLTRELRSQLGALGWYALALPEDLGGSGLSAVEHALFFREVGRQCGPLDVLVQALAANTAQDQGLRAALVAGEVAIALAEDDGQAVRLLGAPGAGLALRVGPEGASLHDISGVEFQARPGLDPATTMAVLPGLPPAIAERPGGAVGQLGQLGTAAMLVGLAEAALDQIVEYAKVRETFGRKIGSYQAVRHPCADMALRVEGARSQLWYAAASLKGARADAQAHLDAAKHLANEAALANADTNIQLHGGIGVTDEHDAHLLLKRSLLLSRLFGAKRRLLARLLDAKLED